MKIKQFQFNMFGVNTYVVWDPATGDAAVVDPGMISPDEQSEIDKFIHANGLKVRHLINTHLHLDHTFGNDYIEYRYKVPTLANGDDAFLGEQRQGQARMFGIRAEMPPLKIGHRLVDGDHLHLGKEELDIIAVPGHSPGSIAIYAPESKFVITGDALFQGSIGRTDLAGGNHAQLIASIRNRLLTLPPDTKVYPGHGPSTTIGAEEQSNPFL